MKKLLLFLAFISFFVGKAQIGIGTNTPNVSSELDITSTKKGILIPRMTAVQRDAINSPANGLKIYVTDDNAFYYYNGSQWIRIVGTNNNNKKINDLQDGKSDNDGSQNGSSIFLGVDAGLNDDSTDNQNVGVGFQSLQANINGTHNTAYGYKSLYSNINGDNNVANGNGALYSNTQGSGNIANGNSALFSNSTGNSNIASGNSALVSNTSGNNNIAIGSVSLYSNTTGNNNIATGVLALFSNTTGHGNVAVGTSALFNNMVKNNLVAVGDSALYYNGVGAGRYEGIFNCAIGSKALYSNTKGSRNTAIGYETLRNNIDGINNTSIGYNSLIFNTSGSNNTAIGTTALYKNIIGNDNTAIGYSSLSQNIGSSNTAIGQNALKLNTNGYLNTAIGVNSLSTNTIGQYNTSIGGGSLAQNINGNYNTAIGVRALGGLTTGNHNTALGYYAFLSGNFTNSSAIGDGATVTANNQVRIGDAVTSIGGPVAWTVVSDARFKKDIKENVIGLDFILQLRPVTYHLNTDAMANFLHKTDKQRKFASEKAQERILQTGFIAQEVEKTAQRLEYDFSGVDKPKNKNDYYGLRYSQFVVPLVKATQEQQKIIKQQQEEINQLKKLVSKIQEQFNQLVKSFKNK